MENNNSTSIYIHTLHDDAFSDYEMSESNYKEYGIFNRIEYTMTPKTTNPENTEYSFVSSGLYVDSDTVAKVTTTESIDPSLNTVKAVTSDLEANGFKLKDVPITMGARGYGYASSTYINDETGEEVVIETTTENKVVKSIRKTTTKNTTVGELYTEKTGKVIGQNEDLLPENEASSEVKKESSQSNTETVVQELNDDPVKGREPTDYDTASEAAKKDGYNITELGQTTKYAGYIYLNGVLYCYDASGNHIATMNLSKSNMTSLNNLNFESFKDVVFDEKAYSTLENILDGKKGKNIDIEDIKSVKNKVCLLINYFQEDITISHNKMLDLYSGVNSKTKEKFNALYGLDDTKLIDYFNSYQKIIINNLNDIMHNLITIIEKNIEIDNNESGVRKREYNSYTPSGGGSSSDTPSSNPNETINNIEKVPNYDEVMTKYSSVMVATVLFNEITPLFEKIGDTTSVQSVQNSEIYKLIGIVKSEDGKYYYQVIDSSTGRIYLADINSNATLKWDELGERKAIEVVGDSAFVLKSTNEGDNMLERVASKGDVYLVNGDKINVDGIDYYSINDNETGNTAFMPVSDSITDPKLIGEIIKPVVGEVAK